MRSQKGAALDTALPDRRGQSLLLQGPELGGGVNCTRQRAWISEQRQEDASPLKAEPEWKAIQLPALQGEALASLHPPPSASWGQPKPWQLLSSSGHPSNCSSILGNKRSKARGFSSSSTQAHGGR